MSLPVEFFEKIYLASASPRRSELLDRMGIPFEVMVADVDESVGEEGPEMVRLLARRKASAVAARLRAEREQAAGMVLAADTIVWCGGTVLGKPVDAVDAQRMLAYICGRWHEVYTGVCVMDVLNRREETLVERTRVRLAPLSAEDIRAYIATGEPMDKAGAYAIQGMGGMFVEAIEGSPSNVMGLPMAQTCALLRRFAARGLPA